MKTIEKNCYGKYENARSAAEDFAVANNGYLRDTVTDQRAMMDAWCDDDFPETWDGETAAIEVVDNDTFETLAIFAYWD